MSAFGVCLVGLVIGLSQRGPAQGDPAPPAAPEAKADPTLQALLDAHNRERAKDSLPPLRLAPLLSQSAKAHARDMAEHGKMTHDGSDGSTAAERIARTGYHARRSAENIAYGQRKVAEVVAAWMKSPGHRANILGPCEEMGAGTARDEEGRIYWCVNFGTPWPDTPAPEREAEVLAAINAARAGEKKPPVKLDKALSLRCRAQAQSEAKAGAKKAKAVDLRKMGEGLGYRSLAGFAATGLPEAADVVQGLREQESLAGPYGSVGIGVATDEGGVPHWVVVLGTKKSS